MNKVTCRISMSLDAFVARPNQSSEKPFGDIAALSQAKEVAGERNVAITGGANAINQYLSAGLIDELWLHIVPVTIGSGARLFESIPDLKLEPFELSGTNLVTHIKHRVVKK